MSVTGDSTDPISHGLTGWRKGCRCTRCVTANRKYNRDKQSEYRQRQRIKSSDELTAKRVQKRKTESVDSVPKRRTTPGDMESAVIEECATIENAKPTLVVAAKNLARTVDNLSGNAKTIALYNSTLKQLMATMSAMRGDETDKRKTGKRKSGGRLATVGQLTKVKRAQ